MCYTAQLDTGGIFPFSIESVATWEKVRPFPHFLRISAAARPEVPVVTATERGRFQPMRWLLVPPWIETTEKLKSLKIWTANARIEELTEKRLYKPLVEENRCVVFFTGFYEWRHEKDGSKTRYLIKLPDEEPMFLPGLYRVGEIDGVPYASCTVCTMEAQGVMRYVHNSTLRQPVVLGKDDVDRWLDRTDSFETIRERTLEAEQSRRFVTQPPVVTEGELFGEM